MGRGRGRGSRRLWSLSKFEWGRFGRWVDKEGNGGLAFGGFFFFFFFFFSFSVSNFPFLRVSHQFMQPQRGTQCNAGNDCSSAEFRNCMHVDMFIGHCIIGGFLSILGAGW